MESLASSQEYNANASTVDIGKAKFKGDTRKTSQHFRCVFTSATYSHSWSFLFELVSNLIKLCFMYRNLLN
jgi:hypothetical protein